MRLGTSFALLTLSFPSFTSVQGQSAYAGKGIGPDDRWILCDDEFCHPTRAACVDTGDGDFKCECINGWGGNGRECIEDIDECERDSPCPPVESGGFCVNRGPWETENPRYKCGCIPGYTPVASDDHGATACSNRPEQIITESCGNDGPEYSRQECINKCPSLRGGCEETDTGLHSCVCDDGYAYNTNTEDCEDIDECKCDSPCPSAAEGGFCVDYDPDHQDFQKWKCGCLPGYVQTDGDEHGATGCMPEESEDDPCDNNNCCNDETCVAVDSLSGYECQCNKASGLCCVPEQVEIEPTEPCDGNCNSEDNQLCDEQSGKCKCETGYFQPSGLGGTCEPEDECEAGNNECDRNAICVDRTPGYTCVCKEGYEGAGFRGTCRDIDECEDEALYDCPSSEICINTNGGYRCGSPPTTKPTTTRAPVRRPVTPAPVVAPVDPTEAPVDPTEAPVDPTEAPVDGGSGGGSPPAECSAPELNPVLDTTLFGDAKNKFFCDRDVERCIDIERTGSCTVGSIVTYCLIASPGNKCKSDVNSADTYSHVNVYVQDEDLIPIPSDVTFPSECSTLSECNDDSSGGVGRCDLIDNNGINGSTNPSRGSKCDGTHASDTCVKVLVGSTAGSHAKVVFAIKDRGGCEDNNSNQNGLWRCHAGAGGGENCSCSNTPSSCVLEITSCCET